MSHTPYSERALYRRLLKHTRASWPSIVGLFAVSLVSMPLSLPSWAWY